MKKFNLGFYAAAIVSGLVGVVACSSSTPDNNNPIDPRQCTTDQDCVNLGGEFRGRTCSTEGVCVVKESPIAADATDTGCVDNAGCAAKNGGRASICPTPGQKCVDIANDQCEVIGTWEDPNKIVFGAVVPSLSTDSSFAFFGEDSRRNFTMAAEELAGATIGGRRPVTVICKANSAPKKDDTLGVVKHLLSTVDVDVFYAQMPEDMLSAARQFRDGARKRPAVCTHCLHPLRDSIKGISDETDFFQRLQTSVDSAPLFQDTIARFEQRRIDSGNTTPIKVALIGWEYVDFSPLADKIVSTLKFNGKTVAENKTDGRYAYLSSPANVTSAWIAQLETLRAMSPDVVILVGADEMTRGTIPYIESMGIAPKYILYSAVANGAFPSVVGGNNPLLARMNTISAPFVYPDADFTRFVGFLGRFGSRFPQVSATENPGFWVYESMYMGAWAAAAAGPLTGKLTSAQFAQGLTATNDETGTSIALGPATITQMGAASGGTKFKLLGVLSTTGMNATKGMPAGALGASFCLVNAGGMVIPSQSGRVLLTGLGVAVGEDACPLPL